MASPASGPLPAATSIGPSSNRGPEAIAQAALCDFVIQLSQQKGCKAQTIGFASCLIDGCLDVLGLGWIA